MLLAERGEVRVTGALLVSDGGFTLHAATVAGGHDPVGREALVSYALRPPLAQERLTRAGESLARTLALKRPFSDGTVAVDLDPLSLLCRLVPMVPPPRFHTVRYAGVLASASRLRPRIVPKSRSTADDEAPGAVQSGARCGWRPWAELMRRVFAIELGPLTGRFRPSRVTCAVLRRQREERPGAYDSRKGAHERLQWSKALLISR